MSWFEIIKADDSLYQWFKRRGGKETEDGPTQGGWIDCGSCGNKDGPRPCGREDASKGRKEDVGQHVQHVKTIQEEKGEEENELEKNTKG